MRTMLKIFVFGFLITLISCGKNTGKQEENKVTEISNSAISEPIKQSNLDDLDNLPKCITQFIPNDYSTLNVTMGNLNLDSINDIILVIKKNGEDTISNLDDNPERRPLLILVGQSDNTFKLVKKNDNVVYCVDCGGMMGDPFTGIAIKNGYFSVEHYGGSAWRWTRIITFKYSPEEKNWYLHKDGGDSYDINDPDQVETKIRTTKDFGKISFEVFDIYKEE